MSEEASPGESAPRRRLVAVWLALAAVAWVVYELTQSPALGAIFICLKFGWEDFRTARWLFQRDPDRARREALFCVFCAWGLVKTALVAFLMSVGFALVARNPAPAILGQALFAFVGTFLTTLVAMALAVLLAIAALVVAIRNEKRLWLGGAVHRARRHDVWPPTPFCLDRSNRLTTLLLTCMGSVLLVLVLLLLILAALFPGGQVSAFVMTITAPVLLALGRKVVTDSITAESPQECWPEEW